MGSSCAYIALVPPEPLRTRGPLRTWEARRTLDPLRPRGAPLPLVSSFPLGALNSLRTRATLDPLRPLRTRLAPGSGNPLVAHDALSASLSCYSLGSLEALVSRGALCASLPCRAMMSLKALVSREALWPSLSRCALGSWEALVARETLWASLPCRALDPLKPLDARDTLGSPLPRRTLAPLEARRASLPRRSAGRGCPAYGEGLICGVQLQRYGALGLEGPDILVGVDEPVGRAVVSCNVQIGMLGAVQCGDRGLQVVHA